MAEDAAVVAQSGEEMAEIVTRPQLRPACDERRPHGRDVERAEVNEAMWLRHERPVARRARGRVALRAQLRLERYGRRLLERRCEVARVSNEVEQATKFLLSKMEQVALLNPLTSSWMSSIKRKIYFQLANKNTVVFRS